jgi:hypothetical protein
VAAGRRRRNPVLPYVLEFNESRGKMRNDPPTTGPGLLAVVGNCSSIEAKPPRQSYVSMKPIRLGRQ